MSPPAGDRRTRQLCEGNSPPAPRPLARLYQLRESGPGGYDERSGLRFEDDQGYILATFTDAHLAEERLAAKVRAWWQTWLQEPEFAIERMSHLSPELLCDLVQDLGLEPPPPEKCRDDQTWLAWWKATDPLMSDWQRQRFLQALDRWPPYRLVVVDLCE
jgi:hypothetical protein